MKYTSRLRTPDTIRCWTKHLLHDLTLVTPCVALIQLTLPGATLTCYTATLHVATNLSASYHNTNTFPSAFVAKCGGGDKLKGVIY